MSAAARRRRREGDEALDVDLLDLPPAARWREWMLRVEAAIFASARPVPREALVRLVGETCRFDDLIADLIHELRGRPYDLTLVAGGYALRTKTRFAPAIRAAHPGRAGDAWRAHPDRNLCADGDRLFAAGDAGGDFETGGTRDQPRRHRRPQASRPDRRRHPRPAARRAVRLCDDGEIPGGVRLRHPARPARTSNGSRPKASWREGRGKTSSTARSGWRKRSRMPSRTTTLLTLEGLHTQPYVGVAARPYRARVDWVTATCPSPVCGCSRPGRVRRGCELDVQGCAIAWRPTCGASLHPCWKMPVGDLRRPGERASDGTKDLEANSAGPLAIGGRTSLSVGGNQRLTQWRLACASATSHILRLG